jgi:predicted amino acid racemase
VTLPRLEIDLEAIEHNTRTLTDRLSRKGIRVTGVTKASLGSPGVARGMLAGGATGLADSRVDNLARLRDGAVAATMTLIRSPMLSQAELVVRTADVSLNTEPVVLAALAAAATRQGLVHGVVLMVELGDLREGVPVADVVDLARSVQRHRGLALVGLGTNLACQSGTVPDRRSMAELSGLAERVERACGAALSVVSGGNSANLAWALSADDVGRVDDLRLGGAILLGTEPLHRQPITGLRTDAFALAAEVIEVQVKPAQPWGTLAQGAFGVPAPRRGSGLVRQAVLAIGRQDCDPDGLVLPDGYLLLGMSSDHLVVDVGSHDTVVGDEVLLRPGYSGLLRAMTSPYVLNIEREPAAPAGTARF